MLAGFFPSLALPEVATSDFHRHRLRVPGRHPILEPIVVGGIELRNRAVVAPMSRVSTRGDGLATDDMAAYYETFAAGQFGLIVTEGTYTDLAYSQAYGNQPAIASASHVEAWARVVDRVHRQNGRIFLQLMHAGALTQQNHHRPDSIGPSAVPPKGEMLGRGYGGSGPYRTPREMTVEDIADVVAGFAAAAARASDAGFDGVEVHAANGYLLDQFLTPYTNMRTDEYGGSVRNRIRLTAEVITAIQHEVPDRPVGVRVSQAKVNDREHRWDGTDEAEQIFAVLRTVNPAYIHVASEDDHWRDVSTLAPGVTVTKLARTVTEVPVIANGGLHGPDEAECVLNDGHADLIALGQGALANPDWPRRVESGEKLDPFDAAMLWPEVTLTNSQRWLTGR